MASEPRIEKIGGFNKYEVENWLDTLLRSIELKRDAKKMKAVRMLIVQKKKYLDLLKVK